MLKLACEQNVAKLGIKHSEGWNITTFIDHLDSCKKCSQARKELTRKFNRIVGRRS